MGQVALDSGIRLFDEHAHVLLAQIIREGTVEDLRETAKRDSVKLETKLETSSNVMFSHTDHTHPARVGYLRRC